MKKLNRYGKGREAVINEMIDYCDKEIEKTKLAVFSGNKYKEVNLKGQVLALIRVKQKLAVKQRNLKEFENLTNTKEI